MSELGWGRGDNRIPGVRGEVRHDLGREQVLIAARPLILGRIAGDDLTGGQVAQEERDATGLKIFAYGVLMYAGALGNLGDRK